MEMNSKVKKKAIEQITLKACLNLFDMMLYTKGFMQVET